MAAYKSYTMFGVKGWLVEYPEHMNMFPMFTTKEDEAKRLVAEANR